jgi:hypothetical protein
MRKRFGVAGYAATAAAVAVGLGAGLGLWFDLGGGSGSLTATQAASSHGLAGKSGGTVGAGQAETAASACGRSCFSLYTRRLGQDTTMNAVIPADNGSGGKAGRKINLRQSAAKVPDGDFTMSFSARVGQFCGIDVHDFFASDSYVCSHDSNFWMFEAQWSPNGTDSGLCAGVATADLTGETVTLRPCGVSDHTLWIADAANGTGGNCRGSVSYCPWMSASDNNFRMPQVLTMDGSTSAPADQLRLSPINLLPAGNQGRAWNNQEFAYIWHAGI